MPVPGFRLDQAGDGGAGDSRRTGGLCGLRSASAFPSRGQTAAAAHPAGAGDHPGAVDRRDAADQMPADAGNSGTGDRLDRRLLHRDQRPDGRVQFDRSEGADSG